jgi:hypothetical protein
MTKYQYYYITLEEGVDSKLDQCYWSPFYKVQYSIYFYSVFKKKWLSDHINIPLHKFPKNGTNTYRNQEGDTFIIKKMSKEEFETGLNTYFMLLELSK